MRRVRSACQALPVARIAAKDAFLFLWIPPRSNPVVEPVSEAWGFHFSGLGFSWPKLNKKSPGWWMGGGYGARTTSSFVG